MDDGCPDEKDVPQVIRPGMPDDDEHPDATSPGGPYEPVRT